MLDKHKKSYISRRCPEDQKAEAAYYCGEEDAERDCVDGERMERDEDYAAGVRAFRNEEE